MYELKMLSNGVSLLKVDVVESGHYKQVKTQTLDLDSWVEFFPG